MNDLNINSSAFICASLIFFINFYNNYSVFLFFFYISSPILIYIYYNNYFYQTLLVIDMKFNVNYIKILNHLHKSISLNLHFWKYDFKLSPNHSKNLLI